MEEYGVKVIRRFRFSGRLCKPGDEIYFSSLRSAAHVIAMRNAVAIDARTAMDTALVIELRRVVPPAPRSEATDASERDAQTGSVRYLTIALRPIAAPAPI